MSSYDITASLIRSACGGMCTVANTTITNFMSASKLNYVEVWSPASAAAGAASFCEITWYDLSSERLGSVGDSTMGSTFPMHFKARPPKLSAGSLWYGVNNGANIFQITTLPAGSVVDVNVTFVFGDSSAGNGTWGAASATIGRVYYPALDGSTDQLVPVGLPTTT